MQYFIPILSYFFELLYYVFPELFQLISIEF